MTSLAETLMAPLGRTTPARLRVLEILLQARHALSHGEIEAQLAPEGALDRVTLYRVLDWLVERGLAHKIAGGDQVWRFNATHGAGQGAEGRNSHEHAHFQCSRCGRLFCLDEIRPVLAVSLPKGFRCDEARLTLHGLCAECNV